MARVLLVHWKAEEAEERAKLLRRAGHRVECYSSEDGQGLRELRADPPEAVVIDLSRLPSHGREVATFLRQQKATRHVPLVFAAGEKEKTAKIRALLPDATYTDWRRFRAALRSALKTPLAKPVVPGAMAGYSGTPLPKKLGIREGTRVALLSAPKAFATTLGTLPEGVRLARSERGAADVVLLFARTRAELAKGFPGAVNTVAEGGKLWMVWPKKTSSLAGDLAEAEVRAHGLGKGWVDFKICAVDETWSGLCFARRKRALP